MTINFATLLAVGARTFLYGLILCGLLWINDSQSFSTPNFVYQGF